MEVIDPAVRASLTNLAFTAIEDTTELDVLKNKVVPRDEVEIRRMMYAKNFDNALSSDSDGGTPRYLPISGQVEGCSGQDG